jgi:hypothetical protein
LYSSNLKWSTTSGNATLNGTTLTISCAHNGSVSGTLTMTTNSAINGSSLNIAIQYAKQNNVSQYIGASTSVTTTSYVVTSAFSSGTPTTKYIYIT